MCLKSEQNVKKILHQTQMKTFRAGVCSEIVDDTAIKKSSAMDENTAGA